jgi:hypothetical protein
MAIAKKSLISKSTAASNTMAADKVTVAKVNMSLAKGRPNLQ